MGACTGFIFAALLEFTLTNYLWRKGTKVSESERIPTDNGHKKDFGPIEKIPRNFIQEISIS